MAIQIRESKLNSGPIQSGLGIPSHISSIGSLYIDRVTGIVYINKNGLASWSYLFDSSTSIGGGGAITSFAYNSVNNTFSIVDTGNTFTAAINVMSGLSITNGLKASTVSATTYYNLPSSSSTFTGGSVNGFTVFNSGLTVNSNLIVTGNTNVIYGNTLELWDGANSNYVKILTADNGIQFNDGTNQAFFLTQSDNITFGNIASLSCATISNANLTGNRQYDLPNASGNIPLTVNGKSANTLGDITIPSNYLFLSGGTVTGATIFKSSVTANTLNVTGNTLLQALTATSISASTYQNLPKDIFVTGGTYSAGTATLVNNTGGTFTISGFSTSVATQFTGGTVTGATQFTGGLSANTISASTYYNLPLDIRTTGVTYDNNTFTYTNNTGGTYSTIFNTLTGLTVNGSVQIQNGIGQGDGQLGVELLTSSGWTSSGWTGSYPSFTHITGNTSGLTNTLTAVSGNYYQVVLTITGRTTGTTSVAFGGITYGSIQSTQVQGFRAISAGSLVITPTTDFDGAVSTSIKQVTAGTATQTWASSAGTVTNELRASSINTNTFIGLSAGSRNVSGSTNTFVGSNAGANNISGDANGFIGSNAGRNNTSGDNNYAFGEGALQTLTTGSQNIAIGQQAAYSNNTVGITVVGHNSLQLSTGSGNSAFGNQTLLSIVNGDNNVAIGYTTGRYFGSSSGNSLTQINNSLLVGYNASPLGNSQTNQIVIGYQAIGLGSNTTVLGNSSTVTTAIWGNLLLGTTTDNLSRLQVQNSVGQGDGQLGIELLSGGTGTNWSGASFTSGYTHGSGSTVALTSVFLPTTNSYYQVQYNIVGNVVGTATIAMGGVTIANAISNIGITASGIRATSTAALTVTPTTGFTGTVFISVKLITQGSATQTWTNSAGVVTNELRASSSSSNFFMGTGAGGRNMTGGTGNVFIGANAGQANTTASNNTFIGQATGQFNTIGNTNTFVGQFAGSNNTTGNYNIFIGQGNGGSNTTGESNSALGGFNVLSSNITGSENTAMGNQSLASATASTANSAIGYQVFFNLRVGSNNTGIGWRAGRYFGGSTSNALTTLNNSVLIGHNVSPLSNGGTNEIVIAGYTGTHPNPGQVGLGSNTTVLGNSFTTATTIFGALTTTSSIVNGNLRVTGSTSATSITSTGVYGRIVVNNGNNNGMLTFSGSGTVGGTGYTDFIRVTNTASGATNINKTFRLDNTGDIEIVSSDYSTVILSLTDAGVLFTPGGGASDRRVKNNIEYISGGSASIINQLKPVKFEYNQSPGITRHGFIAQDVLDIEPKLVLGDGSKENGVYGLDYDGILALTVKSLQEALARIDALEKELKAK